MPCVPVTYEDVILPFDGSEGATAVLRHASEIARWADATVQIVRVADSTRDSVTVVDGRSVDALARRGEDIVDEAADALDGLGVAYDTDVAQATRPRRSSSTSSGTARTWS